MNGQAARQQADGVEDRRLEHLARSWSSEALPYIEKISNHKNREDRRFGNNEADHRDFAAIGQPPGSRCLWERTCDCTHCFLPLLIATVFIRSGCLGLPDVSDPTMAGGSRPLEWKRSCTQAAANLWPIQVSRRPRGRCPLSFP